MKERSVAVLPEMHEIWQQTLNWQPSIAQQAQFQQLYEAIVIGNQKLNLTRITAPEEFWEKHLWDSLRGIVSLLPTNYVGAHRCPPLHKIIDIGTGAGFPGIPVAIALPDAEVTLLDSTQKKVAFLNSLMTEMSLQNIQTLVGRAENINKQPQQSNNYDIALVRAVAAADVCANYALPFLKAEGLAVLYRGNWTKEEQTTLEDTVKKLSGKIEKIENFTTPLSHGMRHCIYLRKINS
ncbi:MAG: Ribosomal RNA small subunit methyltransferase G [Chroococcidiopsis cubana SAG 39.79]|uniref:Ribosomal RNA small subunit methyltransferase G n=1 Tax=Chroococcidiopsis cubana SAG 39.79 TaxID=388085 RepID=A0AB37UF62_9CYAN|nr:16S rRNA (guanine(527)-N(7))-methyltransferase RsmG [Chroococcidiopsis cubana]MDZ4873287.1 Ribosomal RNA small subunit methyltransferase G [Chroococcidiopsis cubana SAG 39.79]PSB60614.1 16S rRNA (guanine(527)-N(7))-methyltransferase RsmG [Chroococcidiopsis cubana CCALA 043]RUT08026.1 ribosomal RNA small subunit methyltransferase G [Chroococcidiopsis cubana SAG 39.79]